MLSDLIKELQAALAQEGDMPVDFVLAGGSRRPLRRTATFTRIDTNFPVIEKVLQITLE